MAGTARDELQHLVAAAVGHEDVAGFVDRHTRQSVQPEKGDRLLGASGGQLEHLIVAPAHHERVTGRIDAHIGRFVTAR